MKTMKRALSFLLAMILVVMPMAAYAIDEPVALVNLVSGKTATIGDGSTTDMLTDGGIPEGNISEAGFTDQYYTLPLAATTDSWPADGVAVGSVIFDISAEGYTNTIDTIIFYSPRDNRTREFRFSVSDDGETWTVVADDDTANYKDDGEDPITDDAFTIERVLTPMAKGLGVTANYIKVEVARTASDTEAFLSEIEVLGTSVADPVEEPETPEEPTNVAAGATVTIKRNETTDKSHEQQTGAGFKIGAASILTDGTASDTFSAIDGSWVVFQNYYNTWSPSGSSTMTGEVVIALDDIYALTQIKLHLSNAKEYTGTSITTIVDTESVKLYFSEDGTTWSDAVDVTIDNTQEIYWTSTDVEANAKYIKVALTLTDDKTGNAIWGCLIDEVEAYAVVPSDDDTTSDDTTSDDTTSDDTTSDDTTSDDTTSDDTTSDDTTSDDTTSDDTTSDDTTSDDTTSDDTTSDDTTSDDTTSDDTTSDDTTSDDTTSDDTTSDDTTSDDTTSDDTSDGGEEPPVEDEPTVVEGNVAEGATVTIKRNETTDKSHEQQTGAGFKIGAASILTDGTASDTFSATDGSWVVFQNWYNTWSPSGSSTMTGEVVIALDDLYALTQIRLHLSNAKEYTGTSITTIVDTESVKLYFSEDGTTWSDAVDVTIDNTQEIYWTSTDVEANAKYIKVALTLTDDQTGNAIWGCLIDEVEAYCVAPVEEPEVGTMENPDAITMNVGDTKEVSVPAGGQYYITLTLPQVNTDYQMTVTGETGFGMTVGMSPMPIRDTNGEIVATVQASMFTGGVCQISVINMSEADATYTLALAEMPIGSESKPEEIELVLNEALGFEKEVANMYWYTWTAPAAGTFVLNMNNEACANGWAYNVIHGDAAYQFSTVWDEADKNLLVIAVAEGDVVKFGIGIDPYMPAEGTVVFTVTYADYTEIAEELAVDKVEYTANSAFPYNVYAFAPTEVGKYTISSENLIGIVSNNGMWLTVDAIADAVGEDDIVFECTSVGQSIWVAVATVAEAEINNITVTREEITIIEIKDTVYENVTAPETFVYEGDASALEYVDVEDDVVNSAVLGEDGLYHLDTVDGPVLYVVLNDELMSLLDASGYGQLADVLYDEDGNAIEKVDYNTAFGEYAAAAYTDEATGLMYYPLTDDLITIIKNVSDEKGWFGENGFLGFTSEDAWMFLCCYATAPQGGDTEIVLGDVDGNGEVDADDYILAKRLYFGTATIENYGEESDVIARCDLNPNGEIDADDYILLKRAYFGTYKIEG